LLLSLCVGSRNGAYGIYRRIGKNYPPMLQIFDCLSKKGGVQICYPNYCRELY